MSSQIRITDNTAFLSLPIEAVEALGVDASGDVDVTVMGRALVIRSLAEAERSRDFAAAFGSVLSRRRRAYEQLAQGPDSRQTA